MRHSFHLFRSIQKRHAEDKTFRLPFSIEKAKTQIAEPVLLIL